MRRPSSLFVIALCVMLLWLLRPAPLAITGEQGEATLAPSAPGTLVVDLRDHASAEDIAAFERRHGVDLSYSSAFSEDEALLRADVPDLAGALARVRADPLVELAEPVVEVVALGHPNDPLWDKQWNMRMIGVQEAWRVGAGGGVRVAVLDTGVSAVEDLAASRLEAGHSFVPGVASPADDHGHGTHVAGTIGQTTHNGLGVAGVAPEVTLVPYKVLDARGSGSSDAIAAAVDHAADTGVHVINMSLGGGHSAVLHKAVNEAARRGVIVVVAAGNSGRRGVSCPGHAEHAVGVAAVGPDGQPAFYSSYGPGVDIAAPGGDTRVADGGVLQDTVDGRGGHAYRAFQGTSMATPHVAGAAAVLLGMGLSPERALALLYETTSGASADALDERTGRGRMDLSAAVRAAQLRHNGLLFGMGAVVAFALASMTGLNLRTRTGAAFVGATAAGGLFFLPLLGLPPHPALDLLGRGLLAWPSALLGADWSHFPLWTSAVFPAFIGFALGPSRWLGGVALGVCAGFGVGLLHAAFAGTLDPWWLGASTGRLWLGTNGLAALGAGAAVSGLLHTLRR